MASGKFGNMRIEGVSSALEETQGSGFSHSLGVPLDTRLGAMVVFTADVPVSPPPPSSILVIN